MAQREDAKAGNESAAAIGSMALATIAIVGLMIRLWSDGTLAQAKALTIVLGFLTIPYLALYGWYGRRLAKRNIANDAVFRRSILQARSFRWVAIALSALFALSIALPIALNDIDFDMLYGFVPWKQYEMRIGTPYFAEPAEIVIGKQIVSGVSLGGMAFLGAHFCLMLLVGAFEVAVGKFGMPDQKEPDADNELQDAKIEETDEDPETHLSSGDEVPADLIRLVKENEGNNAIRFTETFESKKTGTKRHNALQSIYRTIALSHVRTGLVTMGIFALWVPLTLVAVALGWSH